MKPQFLNKIFKNPLVEWVFAVFFAGALFFLTIWLIVLLYLPYYTRQGREVEVPYVIGLVKDEAMEVVKESGLRYTFVGRGKYVVKTVPGAGTIVKEGRRINLTLSDRLPE